MNNEQIKFLLKYSKIGVLYSMKTLDPIDSDELKQDYLDIKKSITSEQTIKIPLAKGTGSIVPGQKKDKMSAVKNWASGIGGRQRAYQEKHKDGLM